MKLALITDGIFPYAIGGVQRHSYYLAKYFAQNKVWVDLYHTYQDTNKNIDELSVFSPEERKYIRSYVVPFPKPSFYPGHYISESYKYSKKIFSLLQLNLHVDFIYVQGFTGWWLLAEKKKGIQFPPIGINFHGLNMFQKTYSWFGKVQQWMFRYPVIFNLRNADFVFSFGGIISEIIKKAGVESKRIFEIPIGVESEWINPNIIANTGMKRLLFVGRYERVKGIEELSKVLISIEDNYDFEFHFVGNIPKRLQIDSPKVTYWGEITDNEQLKSIYRECDVLVCPSHSEGMPNVILEAMASGLAVIATDVGAVNVMVSEKNGWLIEPGNIYAIRTSLEEALLIPNEDLFEKRKKSVELVEKKFLWSSIIDKIIEQISTTDQL